MKDKNINPTLTKNMPNVKWDQLPPRKELNSQGVNYGNVPSKNKLVELNKKISRRIYSRVILELNHYQGLTLLLILIVLFLG